MTRLQAIILSTAFVLLLGGGSYASRQRLDGAEFRSAREAMLSAEAAGAPYLREADWRTLDTRWDSTLAEWDAQLERVWVFRSLERIDSSFASLGLLAARIESESIAARDSLTSSSRALLEGARKDQATLAEAARRLPSGFVDRNALRRAVEASGRARVRESEGRIDLAAARAAQSAALLDSIGRALETRLADLRRNRIADRATADSLILASRSGGRHAIIVDKASRLLIHSHGGVIDSLEADFGPTRLRPKVESGDRATPEGLFRVSRVLPVGRSRYLAALVLDYPRATDVNRHGEAKRSGQLSPNSQVGGGIEIHGGGGAGVDWTDGCVAISDAEIRKLVRLIPVGTPVFISASLSDPVDWTRGDASMGQR